jgi:1,4-dihydroxy-2-naphthoate octaprenyltransferase
MEYTCLTALGFLVLLPIAAIEIADSDSWSALWWLLPWLTAPLAVKLVGVVRTRVDGPTLNGALARTAGLQLLFCVLLTAGILIS